MELEFVPLVPARLDGVVERLTVAGANKKARQAAAALTGLNILAAMAATGEATHQVPLAAGIGSNTMLRGDGINLCWGAWNANDMAAAT